MPIGYQGQRKGGGLGGGGGGDVVEGVVGVGVGGHPPRPMGKSNI